MQCTTAKIKRMRVRSEAARRRAEQLVEQPLLCVDTVTIDRRKASRGSSALLWALCWMSVMLYQYAFSAVRRGMERINMIFCHSTRPPLLTIAAGRHHTSSTIISLSLFIAYSSSITRHTVLYQINLISDSVSIDRSTRIPIHHTSNHTRSRQIRILDAP